MFLKTDNVIFRVLNATMSVNGIAGAQFCTLTCPISGLAAWFVISKFFCGLFKKLSGFICFPRANKVLLDGWRAGKWQGSSNSWKTWIFLLCGLKTCSLVSTVVCRREGERRCSPFLSMRIRGCARAGHRTAQQWLEVTVPIGELRNWCDLLIISTWVTRSLWLQRSLFPVLNNA